jgi:hypothetical protein
MPTANRFVSKESLLRWKIVNNVAATLRKKPTSYTTAQPEATRLVLNFLNGMEHCKDAESIRKFMAREEVIEVPVARKDGKGTGTL